MQQDKIELASSIVEFLNKTVKNGDVSGDDVDSLTVAIDCIKDVFNLDETSNAKDLLSIFTNKQAATSGTASSSKTNTVEVSEEDKKRAEDLKVEGNRRMAQGNFQEAVDYYTKAIEIDPTNAVYFSNRSAAYSSLKEPKKAAEDAEKAIELNPAYSKAYSRLGLARYSMGDAEGSMEAYKKGLEAEGNSPSAGMLRGFETAKKRVEENLTSSRDLDDNTSVASEGTGSSGSGAGGAGAGGFPDISSLLSNPELLANAMNNPQLRAMAESLGGSGANGLGGLSEMMQNPAIMQMANQFMQGFGGLGNNGR